MIDISLPLSRNLIAYPGDAKYEEYEYYTHEKNHVHIMRVIMETHSGTHFDAPFHMLPDGGKADEVPLDKFMGKATVVKVEGDAILPEHIPSVHNDIILFRTKNSGLYRAFDISFTYLSKDAADKLVREGVKLVGIDYLSIEKFGSPDPIVHKTLLGNGVVIVEGLYMPDVAPGEYEFICLPLKMSSDGAPCRAILK